MTLKFGLDVAAKAAGRTAKDDCESTCLNVEVSSGRDGNKAVSSEARLLNCSHANLPASPSFELKLRSLELELPGRLLGVDRAVDGLESSDCASYMSLNVLTDFFKRTAGCRGMGGALCTSCADVWPWSLKEPRPILRWLFCFLIVLGRSTCCGLVGKGDVA